MVVVASFVNKMVQTQTAAAQYFITDVYCNHRCLWFYYHIMLVLRHKMSQNCCLCLGLCHMILSIEKASLFVTVQHVMANMTFKIKDEDFPSGAPF